MIRGRKRKLCYKAIVTFALKHPTMLQEEIAKKYGTTQSQISGILQHGGIQGIRRGRPLTPRSCQSSEKQVWEKVLHDCGLGTDRGLRLGAKRILYGYDVQKESLEDDSATSNYI